jgi:hypothetical protein
MVEVSGRAAHLSLCTFGNDSNPGASLFEEEGSGRLSSSIVPQLRKNATHAAQTCTALGEQGK